VEGNGGSSAYVVVSRIVGDLYIVVFCYEPEILL